jgi:hypothetical protein
MPRSARLCATGLSPLVASRLDACGCFTTDPMAQDCAGIGQTLYARSDVDRPPEVILPVVEHDRETRPVMNADFEQQTVAVAAIIEVVHRLAHA